MNTSQFQLPWTFETYLTPFDEDRWWHLPVRKWLNLSLWSFLNELGNVMEMWAP